MCTMDCKRISFHQELLATRLLWRYPNANCIPLSSSGKAYNLYLLTVVPPCFHCTLHAACVPRWPLAMRSWPVAKGIVHAIVQLLVHPLNQALSQINWIQVKSKFDLQH